jgi:hypothetical protein
MPGGAPQAMQFQPLSFASAAPSTDKMKNLGKSLEGARKLFGPEDMNPADLTAGAAVPGAGGPSAVGGPQGPAPLQQPGVMQPPPGTPYSPQAGPVAPQPGMPQPGMPPPQPGVPQPPQGPTPIQDFTRNMTPPMMLDWLKRMTQAGGSILPPGAPGTAAMQSAGLLQDPTQGGLGG